MHAQIMPTLISIVDQRLTLRSSQVALAEFAKVMSECSRIILITVTLWAEMYQQNGDCSTSESCREFALLAGWHDLQSSGTKHDGDSNLLLPVQLQALQLRKWDGQHPYILRDTDRCI